MKAWKQYQEDAACHFRSLGLDASVDVTVKGVRTEHDIDVLVRSHFVGFDVTWIVECKHWKSPVSKLHVLALREIVADLGADRGIIISESGFQSGAKEAANLTNVQVTSLAEMQAIASEDTCSMRLRDLFDRTALCKERYWEIPKEVRIRCGLREDIGELTYSGNRVVEMCIDLLTRAFRGIYPFQSDSMDALIRFGQDKRFASAKEVIDLVEALICELEEKLDAIDGK